MCVNVLHGGETIVTGGHAMVLKHQENPKVFGIFLKPRIF
jgi:hypothetical protein